MSSYRAKACKSYFRWKRDERVRRTASRKAAPLIGSQQVGNTVLYCRETRAGEHELTWNGRSRLIGFEKDKNSLSETHPRDSISVRIAIDRLRLCTSAELLVFHYAQTKGSTPVATGARTQRGFTEDRMSLAKPPRTVDDDRNDEMSEPTQTMNAEK